MYKLEVGSLILILGLAASLRWVGINWDQGQHLHPDERGITMMSNSLAWPQNFREYLDTNTSPLNPNKLGYVYGTFPLFLTKYIADLLDWGDYGHFNLVGRFISGLFDVGTVGCIYLIARRVSNRTGLLAALVYTISVEPIQSAHFFIVDTFLVFWLSLCFMVLTNTNKGFGKWAILGIAFGLALASKITAVVFLPIIAIVSLSDFIFSKAKLRYFSYLLAFVIGCYFTVRLAQPYAFGGPNLLDPTPSQQFLDNLKQVVNLSNPDTWFPPTVLWIKTKPYLFPLENMLLWGLGLPLGIASLVGLAYASIKGFKLPRVVGLAILWAVIWFAYQGGQFGKPMRYFLPVYPGLAIVTGYMLAKLASKKFGTWLTIAIVCLCLVWPAAFISIYLKPHSRVMASEWMYDTLPAGASISFEYWDDGLPLLMSKFPSGKFNSLAMNIYGHDIPEKTDQMVDTLEKLDYIILTSNRLYGSISTVPEKYPVSSLYYKTLFSGALGFEKIAEFSSRPTLPFPVPWCIDALDTWYGYLAHPAQLCPSGPGIQIVDDYADETFTVYDHPKVLIFKKFKTVNYRQILGI